MLTSFLRPILMAVAALVILLACTVSVHAQMSAVDPRIIEATHLYNQGDFTALGSLIKVLREETPPHLEVLFLSGQLHLQAGLYEQAADEFRLMLTRNPLLLRPRLELARALQKTGNLEGARYHYKQVLAAHLPKPVIRNIVLQLRQIQEREPSIRWTLDVVSDSNPEQSPHDRVIYIRGLPYHLNGDRRARPAWGIVTSADIHVPLPRDPTWFARIYGEADEYPGRSLDAQYGQATIGKRASWRQSRFSVELGRHFRIRENREQYDGAIIRATANLRVSPGLALTGNLSMKTLNYPRLTYLDGSLYHFGGTVHYMSSPNQRWEFVVGTSHYRAKEDAYSYTQPNVSAHFVREWRGGWISGVRGQMLRASFDATDPFFGQTRTDKEYRFEFDLLNRGIRHWSFSPRLIIGYVLRNSNLNLYDYHQTYARISLTRNF